MRSTMTLKATRSAELAATNAAAQSTSEACCAGEAGIGRMGTTSAMRGESGARRGARAAAPSACNESDSGATAANCGAASRAVAASVPGCYAARYGAGSGSGVGAGKRREGRTPTAAATGPTVEGAEQ